MNNNLSIGSVAYRDSGIGGTVIKIEADKVLIKYPDGIKRLPISAIVRWESPSKSPKVHKLLRGDRVKNLQTGEIGILAIWYRDRSKAVIETSGGISDWISVDHLKLVEPEIDGDILTIEKPGESPNYRKGDLVRFIGDRDSKRWLRLDDGETLTVHTDCQSDDEWIDCRTSDMKPRQLLLSPIPITQ